MRRRIVYWFFMRRAKKLLLLRSMLGHDFAVEYGSRRGWVEAYDDKRIWLAKRWVGRW